MATSKTLAPTNVTISIPAMADAPDASVFSNCVDKEADAINALNSHLVKSANVTGTTDSSGAFQLTGISTQTHTVLAAISTNRIAVVFVYNTTWNVKVLNISNLAPATETSVTVTYFYVQ